MKSKILFLAFCIVAALCLATTSYGQLVITKKGTGDVIRTILNNDTSADPIVLDDDIILTGTPGETYTISGVISGGFGITFKGGGTLTLSGANTFSGAVDNDAGSSSTIPFVPNPNTYGSLVFSGPNAFTKLTTRRGATTNFRNGPASLPSPLEHINDPGGIVTFDNTTYNFSRNIVSPPPVLGVPLSRVVFDGATTVNVTESIQINSWVLFGNGTVFNTIGDLDLTSSLDPNPRTAFRYSLYKTGNGALVFSGRQDYRMAASNPNEGTAGNLYINGGTLSSQSPNERSVTLIVTNSRIHVAGGSSVRATGLTTQPNQVIGSGITIMLESTSAVDVYGTVDSPSKMNPISFTAPNGFFVNIGNDFKPGVYPILFTRDSNDTSITPIPRQGKSALNDCKSVRFFWNGQRELNMVIEAKNVDAGPPSSTQVVCPSTSLTPITHSVPFQIGADATSVVNSPLPNGVTATYDADKKLILISGTPAAATDGVYNYEVVFTPQNGCGKVTAKGKIEVKAANDVTANSVAPPSSTPTVCVSTPILITHTTVGASGVANDGVAGANELPPGVAATWANNKVTISGVPTHIGEYIYTVPLTGGCGAVSATGKIVVTSGDAATNSVGAASSTPTLCVGTLLAPITHSTAGATGVGAAMHLPLGVAATWANNTITIIGTPATSGVFNYSILLTGGCGVVSATGTITVLSNIAGPATGASTACIDAPIFITHSTAGTGATGIGTATGLPAGVSAQWANNTITISGAVASASASPFSYTIPLVGGCGAVSATGTISITESGGAATNTASPASASPSVCPGSAMTAITHTTTGATGIGAPTGLPSGVSARWENNILTISGTPTAAPGTFDYTIPLAGGCGRANATGTITVTESTGANTVGPASLSPIVCIYSQLDPITHTTTGATGIGTATGLPLGVSASWAADKITIRGLAEEFGVFNYSIPVTGGCGAATATGRITVWKRIADEPSSIPTLCPGTPLTPITHSTQNTGATGIVGSGVSGANGLPAGVSASWANDVITITGVPDQLAAGVDLKVFNYAIPLTTAQRCGGVLAQGTILIRASATSSNTVGVASSTPELCPGAILTPITHTTTGATGIGVAVGLPEGITASWENDMITISGRVADAVAIADYAYSIPLVGGCGAEVARGTIKVTSSGAQNTASGPSATPTVCINTALTPITHTTTGATGIGTTTGLPAGVSARWAADRITITGTPRETGPFAYSIQLTGGCGLANAEGTITVSAASATANSASLASSTPTVCAGTQITDIVHTTTGGTGIGTPVGLPSGVTASWANNTITIAGTPAAAGTFAYNIPLTGGCGAATATGTITVVAAGGLPANTVGPAIGGTPTACVNTELTRISHTSSGATGIGTTTGLPPGVTAFFGANDLITISGSPTEVREFGYTIQLTGGCGAVNAVGTIKVTNKTTVSQASLAPAVKVNTVLPEITHTTTDATTIGDAINLPQGVSARLVNNTITISGTPTTAGSFAYRIPVRGCGTESLTAEGTIVVTPATAGQPSSNPASVVVNTPITPAITIGTDGATGIGTPQGLPPGVTASFDNGVVTISGTPTDDGTFSYRIPLTGGGFVEGVINVAPPSAAEPSRDPASVVADTPIAPPITILTNGATGIGTPEGLPPGVTASFNNGVISISGTPTDDGIYNYRIPLEGGGFAEGTIVVTPPLGGGTPSSDPAIVVVNTAITPPIKIPADGATGIGTPVDLPPDVTALFENGQVVIRGTPTDDGTFDYWIPLEGGGFVEGRIVVTPPTASEPSSDPAIVAINRRLEPVITIATQGTDGIIEEDIEDLPPGVTASFLNGVISLSGTPTSSGTFNYRIPLEGGGFAEGTIVVAPPTVGEQAHTPVSVVVNTPITPAITIPPVGTTGIGTPTGLPPGVTAGRDENGNIIISGTPTSGGVFDYQIPVQPDGSPSIRGRIIVAPPVASTPSSDPALVVVNTPVTPPITVPTTGATGIGTPENLPPGITASFENGVITLSGTPTEQGAFDYRIPLTGGGFADGRIMVTSPTAEEPSSDPAAVVANVQIAPPITIATNGTNGIGEPIIGLPPGVTASFANGVITLSGTPTGEGTFDYRIPLIGGGFATGTINVLVRQSVTEAASSPTLCINVEMVAIDMHKTTGATGIGAATDLPAGLSATWANNTITIKGKPTTAGVFNYKIPLVGGVTPVTATGTITVIGLAVLEVEITGFEDGITALLTSSATSGNHQWFKNGAPIADATTPTYTVNLRDEFGLTNKELAKDKFMVKVTEGGCTSQSAERTLGITTADEPRNTSRSVVVYPNPVTDQTTVLLAGYEGRKTIALYNLMGEKLSQQQIDGESAIISLASYPSGTYIVKVAGNNSEKSVLVIKQ